MAVGFPVKADYVTGDVLTANNMNDLSGTLNTIQSVEYAAGKNKIINGDFGVWQRGTSFSNPATAAFQADRWSVVYDGTGATRTVSQQTFTPGTAPVAGYEGRFFYRYAQSVAGSGGSYNLFQNRMEDVRTFAGQTITISFWGKAAATTSIVKLNLEQEFGSGGSPSGGVSTDIASTNFSLTTSWQRFTVTTTVPSISGKTIGTTTSGFLGLRFWIPINSTFTLDFWGVQVEASSTASDFQTATGTLQGELAACQRYYYRQGGDNLYQTLGTGIGANSTTVNLAVVLPSQMRITPTTIDFSTIGATDVAATNFAATNAVINNQSSKTIAFIGLTFASGITANRVYFGITNNSLSGFLGISAEL